MKRLSYVIIGLGITLVCYSQPAAENYYRFGMLKLNQGYGNEAIIYFNNSIKQNPDLVKAYIGRAMAKLMISEPNEALNDINKALQRDTVNPEIYYVRAKIFYSMKEYNKALADIDHALMLQPDYPTALSDKIIIQYVQDKDDRVFDVIAQKLKKKESGYLYFTRGILFNMKGNYSKALADFNKSLAFDSTFNTFEVLQNLGYSFLQLKKYDEALAAIDKAITLKPGSPQGYYLRGRIYFETKNYKEALEDFNRVGEISPDDASATYNAGMCYLKTDDVVKACECFRTSCEGGNEKGCKMAVINCSKKK